MSSEQKQRDLRNAAINAKMKEGEAIAEKYSGYTADEIGSINRRVGEERLSALDQVDPISTRIRQSGAASTRAARSVAGSEGKQLGAGEEAQIRRDAESNAQDALFKNKQAALDAYSGTGSALASNSLATIMGYGGIGTAANQPDAPEGSKVICNELHRQGYLSDEIIKKDEEYGAMIRREDYLVYIGYRAWSDPVVSAMKKSKLITELVAVFAIPWAKDMAGDGSKFGSIVNKVGTIICREIGRVKVWKIIKHQKA